MTKEKELAISFKGIGNVTPTIDGEHLILETLDGAGNLIILNFLIVKLPGQLQKY